MFDIIPAIDLMDGKCVRLAQGDFARRKTYNANPLDAAQQFAASGVQRLHIVDLDGARSGQVSNLKTLETIARATNLSIDFGGGIKTEESLQSVFDAGATYASIGSLAVKDEQKFAQWIETYGGEKFLLGADVRANKIAIDGWQTATEIEVLPFLTRYAALGIRQVFCTDIAHDGLLQGAATDLYRCILAAKISNLKLIASGGVSCMNEILELEKIGCAGVIVGKAIYENRITLDEISDFIVAGKTINPQSEI